MIADEPDVTVSPASPTIEDEEDDEDAWYDTSVLEPIDELMGEAIEDEDIDADLDAVVGADPRRRGCDPTPRLRRTRAGSSTSPQAADDGSGDDDEPSPEDIEAAAEHFSGSIHVDEGRTTNRSTRS